jgi:hypothetical protein
VIMPFTQELTPVYENAIARATDAIGLKAVRADQQTDLIITEGIERGIREAAVCVADLTGLNSNVVYEVAHSISQKKRLVLITQDPREDLPFDLRQFRVHKYENTSAGLEELRKVLQGSLNAELGEKDSLVSLLKEMILPASITITERRCVVAASPLSWRHARQKSGGYKKLRRTSSDYVGIRGLIYAFGLVSSLNKLPDLVDSGDYEPDVCFTPVNFYCLGSPKANLWTGRLLAEFSKRWKPSLSFRPSPNSEDLRDVHVDVHMDGHFWLPAGYPEHENRYQRDFGLIVRGPHPSDPTAMLMVLAGRGSVGTEAACQAVTEQKCLEEIKRRLSSVDKKLNNHQDAFWAVVEMERNNDELAETKLETLRVLATDVFRPR